MKIVGVEIFPLTFEWKRIVRESFGPVGKREDNAIIRIHTDEGITGLGEALTLGPYYSLESQGITISLLTEYIIPKILIGADPFNVDMIHNQMDEMVSEHAITKAAVDFALYDIQAKALKVPLYKLLGGAYTDRIALRWAIGFGPIKQMVQECMTGVQAGYQALKIKVGQNPNTDVECVKAIRDAVGPEIPLTIDMNQAYDPKVAIQVIRKMEASNIQVVEQPVHRRDLYGMNLVRRSVETPIGACESAISIHDFIQVIKNEAADFLNFKIARSGGFYRGKAIVQIAAAANIFIVGSTQLGSGIELAADAHFAVSTMKVGAPPYHRHGYATSLLKMFDTTDSSGITRDIVRGTPKIENGFVYVPQVPGLGVELDEDIACSFLTPGKDVIRVGEVVSGLAAGRK